MIIEQLFSDPTSYLMIVGLVIASIVLHELGHALTATWEGDPTPRMMGHLTWNPLKHMGWFSLALVAVIGIGFGATPVQPRNFRHRRWGDVLVSFAGPAVNLGLATGAAGCLVGYHSFGGESELITRFWGFALYFNVALFLFNMLPLPPFDGFSVLDGIVPLGGIKYWLLKTQPWPMIIAFVLVAQGPFWEFVQIFNTVLIGVWAILFGAAG